MIILFLSASPSDQASLDTELEYSEIQKSLSTRSFELHKLKSTKATDLIDKIIDVKPDIIHFSCHGAGEAGLVFESESGRSDIVRDLNRSIDLEPDEVHQGESGSFFIETFKGINENCTCVILNACYSTYQASEIHEFIPYVFGMNNSVSDSAAISFSKTFYKRLSKDFNYNDSFHLAKSRLHSTHPSDADKPVKLINHELLSNREKNHNNTAPFVYLYFAANLLIQFFFFLNSVSIFPLLAINIIVALVLVRNMKKDEAFNFGILSLTSDKAQKLLYASIIAIFSSVVFYVSS